MLLAEIEDLFEEFKNSAESSLHAGAEALIAWAKGKEAEAAKVAEEISHLSGMGYTVYAPGTAPALGNIPPQPE